MNRNLKIVIGIIVVVILIVIIINIVKSDSEEIITNEISIIDESQIQYDEESGEYYIEDAETGEITHSSYDKKELEIYTIDSEYEAWNPDETDNEEEYEEIEN